MSDQHHAADARVRHERWIAMAVAAALVLARSLVFVFWEQSYFDSDQAIVGLMAKHLAEGRAFPVFYYGQTYMLGVEAYLAAPVFLIAGASVTALKLPLLVLNVAVAVALLRLLERDAGLRPLAALVPVLFFAVPSPAIAAEILAANGGNVAPFVYTVLIWMTRNRPGWCGLVFGLGFLQREFTLYALLALIAIKAIDGQLFTRQGARQQLAMFRTAAEVWLLVQWLKYYSSAAGPGTTMADVFQPRDNLLQLAERICGGVVGALPQGGMSLLTYHWPLVFGTRPTPLVDFGIESTVSQGMPGAWIIVAATILLPLIAIGHRLLTERRWRSEYNICAYLVLVGALSAFGYVVGRCGQLDSAILRYEMLSVFGAVGLGAWFLVVARATWLRQAWIALAIGSALVTAIPHARLLVEYVRHPPVGARQQILRHLEARGITYATADYWLAYSLTFLSNERIIVSSNDFVRIREYKNIIEAQGRVVRIAREPCEGGRPVIPRVYLCGL